VWLFNTNERDLDYFFSSINNIKYSKPIPIFFFAVICLGKNKVIFFDVFLFVSLIFHFSNLAESLKIHIEKVIKEEVSELRREVKRICYFGYFCRNIDQFTGYVVHLIHQQCSANAVQLYIVFVFRYWDCSIFQVQNQVKMKIQEYIIMDECTALPETTLCYRFYIHSKGKLLDLLNVVAIGEIRKWDGTNFKNAWYYHTNL
jgi:hypothetical protein